MNKELLNTPVVKSNILRYIEKGLSYHQIKNKLMDIHLIILEDNELIEFIEDLIENENNI